jgi:hypothetical protein
MDNPSRIALFPRGSYEQKLRTLPEMREFCIFIGAAATAA